MNTTIDQRGDDDEWREGALRQLEAAMVQAGNGNLLQVLSWPDPGLELDLVVLDPTGGPTGSLKDWYVRDLYYDAVRWGRLRRGMVAVDETSGSTGIAAAYWAQRLGVRFIAVMPAHTTPAKQELIRQHGGECHLVSGPGSITEEAKDLAVSLGGHYIDQFGNAATTPDAHGPNSLASLAERQMRRLRHPVPIWTVVPVGTGRTLNLFALHAEATDPATQVCVADFYDSAVCRAWRSGAWQAGDRSATGAASVLEGDARRQIEPGVDFERMNDVIGVTDGESLAMLDFLTELTRHRFGGTTGRVAHGAVTKLLQMRALGEHGSVLVVGGDDGGRYDGTLHSDDWRAQQGFDPDEAGRRLHRLIADLNPGGVTGR